MVLKEYDKPIFPQLRRCVAVLTRFLERFGDALFTECVNLALRCLIIFKLSDFYKSGTKMSVKEF